MVLTVDRSSHLPSGPSTVKCHPPHWPVWRRTAGRHLRAFLQSARRAGMWGRGELIHIWSVLPVFPSNDDIIFMHDVRCPSSQHLVCFCFCMGAGMPWWPLLQGREWTGSLDDLNTNVPSGAPKREEKHGFLWHFPFSFLFCFCFYVLLLFWEDW